MFGKDDPRSNLAGGAGTPPGEGGFSGAEYARFYEMDPQERDDAASTWYARGQNFVVALSETEPGVTFTRTGQEDEYVVLLEDASTGITVTAGDETVDVPGYSIVIVPPGDSSITVPNGGRIVRLFTAKAGDLVAKCVNANAYDSPNSRIPPFEPWPEPVDGYRIRHYSLDVPKEDGRFGKIWRCTTFMVNYFDPLVGPRDDSMLSPHHHDDFEQCSLTLEGNYMHHLRWPWTKNMADWRPDDHEHCGSPSITVIPPPSIHTTRWLDEGSHQLVDIFSPPRMDFSKQDGWVLNADEYPAPTDD